MAEGRVRVPKNPAAPIHCRRHRPACHESPSPQPSPRGRGGSIDTACTSGWRVQPASHGPHLDPPAAGCWTATLSGSPLFRPYQTPLPLGEGGRRPGEGPQKPCRSHSLPLTPACLQRAPSPQPSPRGRGGSFDTACFAGMTERSGDEHPALLTTRSCYSTPLNSRRR